MIKKQKKILCVGICFLIFLSIGFFYLPSSKILAADLEVKYPTISGQTIESTTKLPDYVKYLFNLGMFVGFFSVFLSLIIAGAMYILSPVSVELRTSAKDRVSGAISGLLILALTYLIIVTINPQLSFLNSNELPSTYCTAEGKCMVADANHPADKLGCSNVGQLDSVCQPKQKTPGVYFYKSGCPNGNGEIDAVCDSNADCSAGEECGLSTKKCTGSMPYTSDVSDLGALKNKVNSVGIIQGLNSYISILYDAVNFQGMCQYLDPNQDCQSVAPFASSASIHTYDFSPNGDGVYFYRKSYFDSSGGYYEVSNEQIGGIYVSRLEDLKFWSVPENEQDCVEYDKNGECCTKSDANLKCDGDGRKPPSLAGENISSVKINGNYLVLFVYFGPQDRSSGPWTYCQEFPTVDDVNKIGPEQIKWENIRNHGNVLPNYVVIIPVLGK